VKYRTLGSTGLSVSVVGAGTWQFGGEWGHDFSQREVDAILDEAALRGINLIDTAECYGPHLSEALIGDYLARHDRSRWIVATKFGHEFAGFLKRHDDFSAAGVQRQLDESLRVLRVEAGADVAVAGRYRLDAVVAGRADGDGARLTVGSGASTRALAAGRARLRVDVPLRDGAEAGLVDVRLLGLDTPALAGRVAIELP